MNEEASARLITKDVNVRKIAADGNRHRKMRVKNNRTIELICIVFFRIDEPLC